MFTAALFTVVETWKQHKCLPTDGWMKTWYIFLNELLVSHKKQWNSAICIKVLFTCCVQSLASAEIHMHTEKSCLTRGIRRCLCGILKEEEEELSGCRGAGWRRFRGSGREWFLWGNLQVQAGAGGKAGRQQRWGADKSHGGTGLERLRTGWVSKLLSHLSPWGTASIWGVTLNTQTPCLCDNQNTPVSKPHPRGRGSPSLRPTL